MRGMRWSAVLLMAVIGGACSSSGGGDKAEDGGGNGGSSNNGGTMTDGGPMTKGRGAVRGVVYATNDLGLPNQVLEKVQIAGPDGKKTRTDEKGSFEFDAIDSSPDVVMRATVKGHSVGVRNVKIVKDETGYVEFYVKPVTAQAKFDATKGGRVKDFQSGASATFKAESLVRKSDGKAASGELTAELTLIDPTQNPQMKAFPGKASAKKEGKAGLLESYAPMEVRVKDKDGNELTLKKNAKAELQLPFFFTGVGGALVGPGKSELWSLDEEKGSWKYESEIERVQDGEVNKSVYRGEIAHLSWWNVANFVSDVTCIRGCVVRGDNAVPGALVDLVGVGWPFHGTEVADDKGCFYVDLKQESRVSVYAADFTGISEAAAATTDGEGKFAAEDPSACQNIGKLTLEKLDPNNPCPSGYSPCEEGGNVYCHDLLNDAYHCTDSGHCKNALNCSYPQAGQDFPAYSVCIDGQCACPEGSTRCPGEGEGNYDYCVNILSNRNSCGKTCETRVACGSDELCVDGACVPLDCPKGLSACNPTYDSPDFGPECLDLNSSTLNCGGCSNGQGDFTCGAYLSVFPTEAGDVCVDGVCGCKTGFTNCALEGPAYCINTKTDPTYCGGCPSATFTSCANNQECKNGTCANLACPVAQQCDAHECADLTSDNDNCGDCATTCNTSAGQQCQASKCTCTDPRKVACGSTCSDLSTDRANCGKCGTACELGQECKAGKCTAIECGDLTLCGNGCVDTDTNTYNCGACNQYCSGGTCVKGACTCSGGSVLCGQPPSQYCATQCPQQL